MASSVTSSAGFSTAMLSGSQCGGSRNTQALQEKLFSKLDVNGDGSIDQSELTQFTDFVSSSTQSTSATSDTSSADLFKSMDTDGDGTLSKTELADGAKKLFDELRTQLMTQAASTAASSDTQSASDAQSAGAAQSANATQGPPPAGGGHHHHHGGGGMGSKIASLLEQYRSNATTDTSDSTTETSTLSVAA